ncbi:MAG: glycosyl transferase family 2 [Flavobacteriaceae bacterium]|nr:glycosyl transferase family 2 [Flavobacteriaceae bacterium]
MKTKSPHVIIFMATFNGSEYIEEQLNSIIQQSYKNWSLVISDDNSSDNTIKIIKKFIKANPKQKISFINGPQKGYCNNFLSMVCNKKFKADYYAFSDQDDVWLSNKIEVAINHLNSFQENKKPLMYCGRTYYVSENLKMIGMSPLFKKRPSFKNAIVQNIAGGNTMVFNNTLKSILEKIGITNVVSHDWWVYLIVTGIEGSVFFDHNSYILYRQHRESLIGGGNSLKNKIKRFFNLLSGSQQKWNRLNLHSVNSCKSFLSPNSVNLLEILEYNKNKNFIYLLMVIKKTGIYRQTFVSNFSLILSVIIKRFL